MTIFDWIKSKLRKRPAHVVPVVGAIDGAAFLALTEYERGGYAAVTVRFDGNEAVLIHAGIPQSALKALMHSGAILAAQAPDVRVS